MRALSLLSPALIPEVYLPRAPLVRVIAQVRFPSILAIRDPDKVAVVQEKIRRVYPYLSQVQTHRINLTSHDVDVQPNFIWRFSDQESNPQWQISLGVDFVSLDTSRYNTRDDFLHRLYDVISAVESAFRPVEVKRFGLRYIDRLTGEAVVRIDELFQPKILGIMHRGEDARPELGDSIIHFLSNAQFLAEGGNRIEGQWGYLPAKSTHDQNALDSIDEPSWVLDLDMFTSKPQRFESNELKQTARDFAECLYWLFRQMVTEKFLRHYGGEL